MLAPSSNTMNRSLLETTLGDVEGLLVRQRLDVLEQLLPCCPKANHYRMAVKPRDWQDGTWDDNRFQSLPNRMVAQEDSTFCCRLCGPCREYKMRIYSDDAMTNEIIRLDHPYNCGLPCCCCMICAREMNVSLPSGRALGKVRQDYSCIRECCCCTCHWKVSDSEDRVQYVLEDKFCTNLLAPTCCCPVHAIKINTSDNKETLGHVNNVFPGCNFRGVCCAAGVDNYETKFPLNATPEQKALLVAALLMVENDLFSKEGNE